MKISPDMNLGDLIDCMAPNGEAVTETQAAAMRDLLVRDADTYGWKNTSDVEDADWHRMRDAVVDGASTEASNYVTLHQGGSKAQAERLAENMSVWKGQDWNVGATVFGFADGSAIYSEGPEFRVATANEIAAYK